MLREEQKNYLEEGHLQYRYWKEKIKSDPYSFRYENRNGSRFIRAIKNYTTCLSYPDQYDMGEVNLSLARAYAAFTKCIETICSHSPSMFSENSVNHLDFVNKIRNWNIKGGESHHETAEGKNFYKHCLSDSDRLIFSFNKNINIIAAICYYANVLERCPNHPEAEFELALLMGSKEKNDLSIAIEKSHIKEGGYVIQAYSSVLTIKPGSPIHIESKNTSRISLDFHAAQIALPKIIGIVESAMKASHIYEIKDFIEVLMQLHCDSLAVYEINEKERIDNFLKILKKCKSVREYVETYLLQNTDPTFGTLDPSSKMVGLLYFILSPMFEIKFNECKSIKKIMAARLFQSDKKHEIFLLNKMCNQLQDICDLYSKDYYFNKNPNHALTVVIAMCCHKLKNIVHPVSGRFKDEEMKVKIYLYALLNMIVMLHSMAIKSEDEKLLSLLTVYIKQYQLSAWMGKIQRHIKDVHSFELYIFLGKTARCYHYANKFEKITDSYNRHKECSDYYNPKNVVEKLLLTANKNQIESVISADEIKQFMSIYAIPLREKSKRSVCLTEKKDVNLLYVAKTNFELIDNFRCQLIDLCNTYKNDYLLLKNPNDRLVTIIIECCAALLRLINLNNDFSAEKKRELFYLFGLAILVKAVVKYAKDRSDEKLLKLVNNFVESHCIQAWIDRIEEKNYDKLTQHSLSRLVKHHDDFYTPAGAIDNLYIDFNEMEKNELALSYDDLTRYISQLRVREGTNVTKQDNADFSENENILGNNNIFSL